MPNGDQVSIYTLTNANNMQVSLLNYGGTVKEILVPDRDGNLLMYPLALIAYRSIWKSPYFGCITGRYANRIKDGQFIDGKSYQLAKNNGPTICMVARLASIKEFGMPKFPRSAQGLLLEPVLMERKVILVIFVARSPTRLPMTMNSRLNTKQLVIRQPY